MKVGLEDFQSNMTFLPITWYHSDTSSPLINVLLFSFLKNYKKDGKLKEINCSHEKKIPF